MKKRILAAVAVIIAVCILAAAVRRPYRYGEAISVDYTPDLRMAVIIDAGHGGFDGGAVAPDGTFEKDLNLSVAQKLDTVLKLLGIRTKLLRENDTSLDTDGSTIRERKVSDLKNRLELTKKYPNAIFVSIHMNKYSTAQPHGAQVFYSSAPRSKELAGAVQKEMVLLQTDNKRAIKPTDGNIYLLDRAVIPSVIVECGFLSNPGDLENLKDTEYQLKLAAVIAKAVLEYCGSGTEQIKGV